MPFVNGILSDSFRRLSLYVDWNIAIFKCLSTSKSRSFSLAYFLCLLLVCESIRCRFLAVAFVSWFSRFSLCVVVPPTSFLRSWYLLLSLIYLIFFSSILLIASQMFLSKKPSLNTLGKFRATLDMASVIPSSTTLRKVTCNKSDTPPLTGAPIPRMHAKQHGYRA